MFQVRIFRDNISKNVIIYVDKEKYKHRFDIERQEVSEEIKQLDRKIIRL